MCAQLVCASFLEASYQAIFCHNKSRIGGYIHYNFGDTGNFGSWRRPLFFVEFKVNVFVRQVVFLAL